MIFKPETEQLLLKSAGHDRASGGHREGKETYRGIDHYVSRIGEANPKAADLC